MSSLGPRDLRLNDRGDDVRALRLLLGMTDGEVFDIATCHKLLEYQRASELLPTGVYDRPTRAKLEGKT